ncbi:30S ribosomal protein S15 chloroplastic [Bienertia sinuspersici]
MKKEETGRSFEFQVFCFTNKIQRLTSQLELHKKTIHLREVYEKFWEKTTTTDLEFDELLYFCFQQSWKNELLKNESGKAYDSTYYQKRSHDSRYGPSPSINACVLRLIVTLDVKMLLVANQ